MKEEKIYLSQGSGWQTGVGHGGRGSWWASSMF